MTYDDEETYYGKEMGLPHGWIILIPIYWHICILILPFGNFRKFKDSILEPFDFLDLISTFGIRIPLFKTEDRTLKAEKLGFIIISYKIEIYDFVFSLICDDYIM